MYVCMYVCMYSKLLSLSLSLSFSLSHTHTHTHTHTHPPFMPDQVLESYGWHRPEKPIVERKKQTDSRREELLNLLYQDTITTSMIYNIPLAYYRIIPHTSLPLDHNYKHPALWQNLVLPNNTSLE